MEHSGWVPNEDIRKRESKEVKERQTLSPCHGLASCAVMSAILYWSEHQEAPDQTQGKGTYTLTLGWRSTNCIVGRACRMKHTCARAHAFTRSRAISEKKLPQSSDLDAASIMGRAVYL